MTQPTAPASASLYWHPLVYGHSLRVATHNTTPPHVFTSDVYDSSVENWEKKIQKVRHRGDDANYIERSYAWLISACGDRNRSAENPVLPEIGRNARHSRPRQSATVLRIYYIQQHPADAKLLNHIHAPFSSGRKYAIMSTTVFNIGHTPVWAAKCVPAT